MDFFDSQERSLRRSRWLVVLFILAVLGIIAAVYLIVHVALIGPTEPLDPGALVVVALATMLLVGAGTGHRISQLSQGGGAVARMLGGVEVPPNTSDPEEKMLRNVVEEMAVASGVPVPDIFLLPEEGINAFAAGYTIDDAAIGVTRGAVRQLTREELQGVIAHEFSHILNGDMRLNVRLIGLLGGILLLSVIGRGLMYSGRFRGGRRGGGGGQIAIVGIGLFIVGYIGVVFGRMMQAAVSRQREFLADASAVQFTRNPGGIGGALRRIAESAGGARVDNHHAEEARHMFFASALRGGGGLFATHPPITERIRRIGEVPLDPPRRAAAAAERARAPQGAARRPARSGLEALGPMLETMTAGTLLGTVGEPGPAHIAFAAALLEGLPAAAHDAAHDPEGAQALLFALLLKPSDAQAQRALLLEHGGETLAGHAGALAALIRPLGAAVRLPLLDLLLPALRSLPSDSREAVRRTADGLIRADGRVQMFGLAVRHVLQRQLPGERDARPASAVGRGSIRSFDDLRHELEAVLSAVAWSGAPEDDAAAAERAFGAALAALPRARALTLHPRDQLAADRLDEAFAELREAAPQLRRAVLEASLLAVAHDGRIEVAEAEAIRAVAEAIDIPMPPVVPRAAAGAPPLDAESTASG